MLANIANSGTGFNIDVNDARAMRKGVGISPYR
jgi:hypothetical protein